MRINVTIDTAPRYSITLEEVKRIAKLTGQEVPETFEDSLPQDLVRRATALWCKDIAAFLRDSNIEYIRVIAP